jgi:hypothetical protein
VEYWTQWDVTALDAGNVFIKAVPAPTVHISSPSAGKFVVEFFAWVGPLSANFSTAFPPTNRDFRRLVATTVTEIFHNTGITTIPLPLYNADGTPTPLGAALQANYRRLDSLGRRRFALGMRLSPTSPVYPASNGQAPPTAEMAGAEADIIQLYIGDNFTGWGGRRGTAGRDRAVRCPRCGMVLKEADLVADGVTRTKVCPECYDPPTPPPNWRWPFRR